MKAEIGQPKKRASNSETRTVTIFGGSVDLQMAYGGIK